MKRVVAALLLAASVGAMGQSAEIAQPDAATEERLKALGQELRCLVCQNQTIADSSAPLAVDLRNQIRTQISAGRSDDQIRDYMVERYGEFVLYKPRLRPQTLVLWIGPFALIALGALIFVRIVRRRRAEAAPVPLEPAQRAKLESLLEGAATDTAAPPQPVASTKRKGGQTRRP